MIALSLYKNKKFKLINKRLNKKVFPKQCRLQILYSGICASDIPRAFESMAYKYPLVMGHEFVAKVIDTGTKVSKFEKGDIVSAFPLIPCSINNNKHSCENCENKNFNLCSDYDYYGSRRDGSFCEVLDVNEWNLFKIKNKKKIFLNSLIEPTAVSFNVFEKIKKKVENNSKILILGAGYIGQIVLRVINNFNKKTKIFILDRNKFKLALTKNFSTSQILHSKNHSNISDIKRLNSKFDIVVETTGKDINFLNSIDYVKKGGHVIYAGNIDRGFKISKNRVSNVLRKEVTIKGIWNSSYKSKNDNWTQAEKFITKARELERLITHKVDLTDAAQLMENIFRMKNGRLKNNYLKGIIKSY